MDITQGRNLQLAIGGGLVLLIAGAVYFFYTPQQQNNAVPAAEPVSAATTTDTTVDVSAEVGGAVATPADKLPGTNPFSGYKNPFE